MVISAANLAFWLQLTACNIATAAASSTLRARDLTCSDAEVNTLKCLSDTQYYICPSAGQAPIVQDAAAGTQCLNGALVPIEPLNPNFGDVLGSVSANMAAATFVVPSEAPAPSPSDTPIVSSEAPAPSVSSTPSAVDDTQACPYGGYTVGQTIGCADFWEKKKKGIILGINKKVLCPTNLQYAACVSLTDAQICQLPWDTNMGCFDNEIKKHVKDSHGEVPN